MTVQDVIKAHPKPTSVDHNALLRCIEECLDCAASCTSCADANLAEDDVHEMVRCIRLCLDCADACATTARIVIRQTAPDLRVMRQWSRPVRRRAKPLVTSASGMPRITSTAAFAPRSAAAASRRATT